MQIPRDEKMANGNGQAECKILLKKGLPQFCKRYQYLKGRLRRNMRNVKPIKIYLFYLIKLRHNVMK